MYSDTLLSQLKLHFINNYLLILDRGWSDSDTKRTKSELWLVTGGNAYLNIGDKKYRIKKGDMCLLPDVLPREHGCDITQDFKVRVIQFSCKTATGSLFEYIGCEDWAVHTETDDFKKISDIFIKSETHSLQGLPFERLLQLDRDLNILLCEFFSRTKITALQKNDWLEDTLQYITDCYGESLSLDLLAKRVAMHPKHFARRFRESVGITPTKYIATVRFEKARQMLFEDVPLQQISDSIGMSSIQQFFRFFKSQSGTSPREYQKKNKKGEML